MNLDPIILEKRWIDGESWPNDFVEKVNRGEDLRWVGSRCPLTYALEALNILFPELVFFIFCSLYGTCISSYRLLKLIKIHKNNNIKTNFIISAQLSCVTCGRFSQMASHDTDVDALEHCKLTKLRTCHEQICLQFMDKLKKKTLHSAAGNLDQEESWGYWQVIGNLPPLWKT